MPLFFHKFRQYLSVSGCIVGSYALGFYITECRILVQDNYNAANAKTKKIKCGEINFRNKKLPFSLRCKL